MNKQNPPLVKICGLRDALAARVAIESGALAMGFMLAESRRRVSPEVISSILDDLPSARPPAIGVFVNESAEHIVAQVRAAGLDMIQLSGDESPDILGELDRPAWKAFRFTRGTTVDEASRVIEPWFTRQRPVAAILLDAAVVGRYGGSGHQANWELAGHLAKRYPVILAGGLNPGNVVNAILTVRPIGVDVSSGVERDGNKDIPSIQTFVANSLTAFGML